MAALVIVGLACGDSGSTSDSADSEGPRQEFPGGPCEGAGVCREGKVCVIDTEYCAGTECTKETEITCETVPEWCYSVSDEEIAGCLYALCRGCNEQYSDGVLECVLDDSCP